MWKNPILEFIDENCLVFDEEEENKLEYTIIHQVRLHQFPNLYPNWLQKFKKMVDAKLDQFVQDIGIPPEVFINACEVASEKIHKSIINQLLAVENFMLFKKMMITRNKQLNHEAANDMEGD